MLRVVIESRFRGATPEEQERHVRYARAAVRDSLMRNESPIASHLLHTQPGILRDDDPDEREAGISAGWAWIPVADLVAVYVDCGLSDGMRGGIAEASRLGVQVVTRHLPGWSSQS